MSAFKTPKASLGQLDPEAAATLIAAAADIALVVDEEGVIRDLAVSSADLGREIESHGRWLGRPWIDTVTPESRQKIEALLREATTQATPRWRQVNHPSPRESDVPVSYSAVQAGTGRIVAFGRDLRALSDLQQRLVDAQQSLERDYSRLRHVESRYRLLFEMSADAVVILDAGTHKVVEANPAARTLLGEPALRLSGRAFADLFTADAGGQVAGLLGAIRAAGRVEDVHARLANGAREVVLSASQFRQEDAAFVLVRIAAPTAAHANPAVPAIQAKLVRAVETAPDGYVLTDEAGRVLTANAAFLEMAQLPAAEQALGEPLERWLGRSGVDVDVLIGNLRQRGSVRLFSSTMTGEMGESTDVEVSAVAVVNGGKPCLGFAIRDVGRRLRVPARAPAELPRSVEQLTELIGRVSLKDLVREATDVIERLCIETALDMTGDNRASAAEMLGLSRQSLYVKLRRYGLGDLATETRN